MVNCAAEEESGRTFFLSLNCIKRGLETFSETKKCPKMSTLLFLLPSPLLLFILQVHAQ